MSSSPSRGLSLRWQVLTFAAVTLLVLVDPVGLTDSLMSLQLIPWDFAVYSEAGQRVFTGDLYADYGVCEPCQYRYSPVMAYGFAAVGWLGALGLPLWRVAHVAVLFTIPFPIALAMLLSWPFWWELSTGHLTVFSVVLAVLAIRGSRSSALGYLLLAMMMPKPLFVPIAAWLLWQDRTLWKPTAALFVAHALAVLATGYAGEWIGALTTGAADMASVLDYGPARLIGGWWLAIGIPLAAWLTWKRKLGWASLTASPYWLPYYLLFAFVPAGRGLSDAHSGRRDGG